VQAQVLNRLKQDLVPVQHQVLSKLGNGEAKLLHIPQKGGQLFPRPESANAKRRRAGGSIQRTPGFEAVGVCRAQRLPQRRKRQLPVHQLIVDEQIALRECAWVAKSVCDVQGGLSEAKGPIQILVSTPQEPVER